MEIKFNQSFSEFLREKELNEAVTYDSETYNIAKEISKLETKVDDYSYKYGDSDAEIAKANAEKKWQDMNNELKQKIKDFKSKYNMDYAKYITGYDKQFAKILKEVKPKTIEGKMFQLAMELSKKIDVAIIYPDGSVNQSGFRFANKNINVDGADKKNYDKLEKFYKPLISFGSKRFRDIASNGNSEARTEIDELIRKYVPVIFAGGYYANPTNW